MQYDKYTLTKELGAKGVPVGPVLDWNELENDPDLNEDGTLITIDQGDARGKFKTIGLPFTMSNYAPDYQRAPKLGENNEEILKSLGYTDEQIADLATKGVIGSGLIALHRSHAVIACYAKGGFRYQCGIETRPSHIAYEAGRFPEQWNRPASYE